MKNAFLLLLLANLLVLAWESWVVAPGRELNITPLDTGTPKLVYLSPRPSESDGVVPGSDLATGDTASLPAAGTAMRCVRVGPFVDDASATLAAVSIAGLVRNARATGVTGDVWVGHWVQIRDLETRREARFVLERLKNNGIRDAYIVPTETDYKISMGVFRDRNGADNIADRARGLGYVVDVSDRFRPGTTHWLDLELAAGQQPDLGSLQSEVGRILRTEPYPCLETDTGGAELPVEETEPAEV